jgi:hypothetical protein
MGRTTVHDRVALFFQPITLREARVECAGMTLTSRYDHVREVFATEAKFGVMYKQKLDIIMGGEPFFLGTDDRSQHHDDTAALCKVILP